ncbi:MAG TPA: L,D-transpeptidase [Bacteroidales bacterium]|nr:L,D-transpeptidase [Bacteroidales bacterium]
MEEQNNNITQESSNAAPEKQVAEIPVKPVSFFRKLLKALLLLVIILATIAFLFCVPIYIGPAVQTSWGVNRSTCSPDSSLLKNKMIKKQVTKVDADIVRLDKKLSALIPTSSYMIVNTVDNRFYLYKDRKLIRNGPCSSGKNTLLTTADGKYKNVFKTPRGCRTVQSKVSNPVWTRPDWDYIEQGEKIPSKGDPSRFEPYVLGDYALKIGDGYMIHGTIYKRQMGMPVTHGCVRLNDEDLEVVAKTMNVGSKVYIY